MIRLLDVVLASIGLIATLPLTLPVAIAIYWHDRHYPFYTPARVGKNGKPFKMIKFRSMVVNADKSGVDSTSANDKRLTSTGRFVRRYKVDELPQLWNVLKGEMSLVGPRPNVHREVNIYTSEERHLLDVAPGITDLASIVFSDENDILKDSADPDLDYNQRIRPWKNRLALLFVRNASIFLYIRIIYLTAIALISRDTALRGVEAILQTLPVDAQLRRAASRKEPLIAFPPPGATAIVMSRESAFRAD